MGRASQFAQSGAFQTIGSRGSPASNYSRRLLSKLVNLWPASRLQELMPWAWAAAHSNNKLAA
jgi:hypothetical protein